MRNHLIKFEWEVPVMGFDIVPYELDDVEKKYWSNRVDPESWESRNPVGEHYAIKEIGDYRYRRMRITRPLEDDDALFRNFARLPDDPKAMLSFANKWGRLGRGRAMPMHVHEHGIGNPQLIPEPIEFWEECIVTMHCLVRLWELAEAEAKELTKIFRFSAAGHPNVSHENLSVLLHGSVWAGKPWLMRVLSQNLSDGTRFRPRTLGVERGDYPSLAYHAIQATITDFIGIDCGFSTELCLGDGLRLCFIPRTLIGAMVLQFAQAMDGNREYRRCRACGQWFEVGNGKTYCTNKCRQKEYRDNKKSDKGEHS